MRYKIWLPRVIRNFYENHGALAWCDDGTEEIFMPLVFRRKPSHKKGMYTILEPDEISDIMKKYIKEYYKDELERDKGKIS